jgi:hypothetical protein
MKENIKNQLNFSSIRIFLTLPNIGVVVIAIVALSVSWTSTKVIQRNYKLLKKISVLEQQVEVEEVAVANQRLMNEYYKTDTYLEIAARRQFNKALPGEKLMLVPKALALQKVTTLVNKDKVAKVSKPNNLKNWQKWMRFLSGRAIDN